MSILFLILNASIVWCVIAAILMWLLRSKILVLAIMLAPIVIGSTFQHIAGMPELISFYGISMVYGALGIILGILYIDYARTKAYFQRASKLAFIARGGIALSSLYLLSFFGQRIIMDNPMVQFALRYIDGGEEVKEIVNKVDYDGAVTSAICIAGSFGILAYNKYKENKALKQNA